MEYVLFYSKCMILNKRNPFYFWDIKCQQFIWLTCWINFKKLFLNIGCRSIVKYPFVVYKIGKVLAKHFTFFNILFLFINTFLCFFISHNLKNKIFQIHRNLALQFEHKFVSFVICMSIELRHLDCVLILIVLPITSQSADYISPVYPIWGTRAGMC